MGKIQTPSSPQEITFDCSNRMENGLRRSFLAPRNSSFHALMLRSSSMPRLNTSIPIQTLNREDSVVWGNDSCAQIKPNFSLFRESDDGSAILILLKDIKDAIQEQTNRKKAVERQMSASFKLARARYACGSRIGCILSMRKAHKSKAMKAYIAAARFQLIALRKDIEAVIQRGEMDIDLTERRNEMNNILTELTVAKFHTPDDEELLKQLERSVSVENS